MALDQSSLVYKVSGDAGPYKQAMEEAKAATEGMHSRVAEAAAGMANSFTMMVAKAKPAMVEMFSDLKAASEGSGDALKEHLAGAFDEASNKAQSFVYHALDKLTAKIPLIGGAVELLKPQLDGLFDWAEKSVALGLQNTIFDTGVWEKMTATAAQFADLIQTHVQPVIDRIAATWNAVVFAWNNSSSLWSGAKEAAHAAMVTPFDESAVASFKSTQSVEKWSDIVTQRLSNVGTAISDTLKKKAGLETFEAVVEPEIDTGMDTGRSVKDPYEGSLNKLREQIAMQQAEAAAIGLSAGKTAEYKAVIGELAALQKAGRDLTDEETVALKAKAAALGEAMDATASAKATDSMITGIQAQITALNQEQATLGMSAAKVAEYKAAWAAHAALQSAHLTETPQMTRAIEQMSAALGDATAQTNAMKDRMAEVQQIGTIMANSLSSAFGKFVDGAKVSFGELVSSMLKDLAKMEFQHAMQGLFGGGSGGSGGGLFGSLFGGLLSGARASGGPVDGGSAYLVGEKGPEIFVPSIGGNIVPNHAIGGGGGGPSISLSIDARGATPDAVASLRQQLMVEIPQLVRRGLHEAYDRDPRFARMGA